MKQTRRRIAITGFCLILILSVILPGLLVWENIAGTLFSVFGLFSVLAWKMSPASSSNDLQTYVPLNVFDGSFSASRMELESRSILAGNENPLFSDNFNDYFVAEKEVVQNCWNSLIVWVMLTLVVLAIYRLLKRESKKVDWAFEVVFGMGGCIVSVPIICWIIVQTWQVICAWAIYVIMCILALLVFSVARFSIDSSIGNKMVEETSSSESEDGLTQINEHTELSVNAEPKSTPTPELEAQAQPEEAEPDPSSNLILLDIVQSDTEDNLDAPNSAKSKSKMGFWIMCGLCALLAVAVGVLAVELASANERAAAAEEKADELNELVYAYAASPISSEAFLFIRSAERCERKLVSQIVSSSPASGKSAYETIIATGIHIDTKEHRDFETKKGALVQSATSFLGIAPSFCVGNTKSDTYHKPTCPNAKTIQKENRVYYATHEAARADGKMPCLECIR